MRNFCHETSLSNASAELSIMFCPMDKNPDCIMHHRHLRQTEGSSTWVSANRPPGEMGHVILDSQTCDHMFSVWVTDQH